MTDHAKLIALYDRLAAEQQRLIEASAKIGILPSTGTLRKISDIEHALSAVDAMIEETDAE